ncbi:MAG: histidine phosphatase family protein [Elusimicrobia bacterium]|nr:histidine phosphatase family protein [Elusimicrobiota bacterium]
MRLILVLAAALSSLPSDAAIYVVRHAEKVATKKTDDPPLTAAGRKRAADLARYLSRVPLQSVYVTQFQRTRQTAEPAAAGHKLKPIQVKAEETAALAKTLRADHAGDDVLVVAHSDTIPDLLKSLGVSDGPKEELGDREYDNLFVVDLASASARLHWLRYGYAPAP